MGQECKSLVTENITIAPKEIRFLNHGILFLTADDKSVRLEEDRILLVCIEMEDAGRKRPSVGEITVRTTGKLLLGTVYGTQCRIQTQQMKKTAGEILIAFVQHYPWLWVGNHTCLDSGNSDDWKRLRNMVEQMRICTIQFG